MPPRSYSFRTPSHPLLQVLYVAVGGLLLIGAILMGVVILAIALGLALVVGVALMIRAWWLNRRLGKGGRQQPSGGQLIETDYVVLDERDEQDSRGR